MAMWSKIYSSPSKGASSSLKGTSISLVSQIGIEGVNLLLLLALRDGGVLVLLVLRDQIVHVGLSLSELHLVHTLTSVPMQESLAPEHSRELISNTLEKLLDGGRVSNKGGGHLETTGRDGAKGGLDIVGDPLNKVRRVLVLDIAHLVLDLLHGNLTTAIIGLARYIKSYLRRDLQDSTACEVTTVAEVRSSHHVLGVVHLLGQLRDSDGTERVGATAGKRSESNHEEMETREGNHVDSQLAEIGVELSRESKTGGDTGHDGGDQVVQVTVGRSVELERTHANIVQGLVIDTEGLVRVLDQLMDGEGGVVRLNNGVGNLGGGNDRESCHHAVWELLTDLGDQQRTHTSTGTTTERVGDLETLEAVTSLSLTTNNIEDLVNKLSTLSVMTLRPVVTSTRLAEDKVVGSEKLSERSSTDSVHGTWLEIDENGTRNILVTGSLQAIVSTQS
jgi:hypothetical protein